MENLNLTFNVVRAGTKAIASTPELKISSAQNHFVLNSVALDLMKVAKGDGVLLIMNPSEDDDMRYFIAKAVDGEKSALLGETGSSLHFNYAGIYGSIYMNEQERAIISVTELMDKGFYSEYETPQGNIAKRGSMTLTYTLLSIGEHEIDGEVREVFALTNRKEKGLGVAESTEEAAE